MRVWFLFAVLAPLIILQAAWLTRKRMYRDTVLFAAIALTGFAMWIGIVLGRPLILTVLIGRILAPVLRMLAGA